MNPKFNRNYILNDAENDEMVKSIVDKLIDEKQIHNPFDFLFRSSSNHFPKACHEVLELPGIFEQKLNSSIFSFNGRSLQADYIEKVLPDNKILKDSAILILDHMSYRLNPSKIKSSFEYKISQIMQLQELSYIFIVTNIKYNEDVLIRMSHFDHFSIRVIFVDEEKIQKMLSILTKKDYSKEVFSDRDLIRFVHCLIFSKKESAKDIIRKLTDLFVSIENITPYHQIYLHFTLKTMIKRYFTDEKEIRRLLTMITKTVNPESMDEIATSINYEEKIAELNTEKNIRDSIIAKKQKELFDSKQELIEKDIEIAKKDMKIIENEEALAEKDDALAEKDDALAQKDKALDESNSIIAEKEDEIRQLKKRIESLENGSDQ